MTVHGEAVDPALVDASTFEARDITQPRLVWDPMVHTALYDEYCSYFLLRMRHPDAQLDKQLEEMMHRAHISAYCIYVVYGYYDCLVRIWTTSDRRLELIRIFEKELREQLDDVAEFRVDRVDFLWSVHPDPRSVIDSQRQIQTIHQFSTDYLRNRTIDRDVCRQLVESRLLHVLPSQGSIKLYVVLSQSMSARQPAELSERERASIRDLLMELEPGLQEICFYSGRGFARYLIKAMASSFDDILLSTSKLDAMVRSYGLRPMTLLVANQYAPEHDQIDAVGIAIERNIDRLSSLLRTDAAQVLTTMPTSDKLELSWRLFRTEPLLPSGFKDIAMGFVDAWLRKDILAIAEKLSFLFHLESLVRNQCRSAWRERFGDEWEARIGPLLDELDPGEGGEIATLSLSACIAIEMQLREQGGGSTDGPPPYLGTDSLQQLARIVPLLDSLRHGTVFESEVISTAEFLEVIDVIHIYSALVMSDQGLLAARS